MEVIGLIIASVIARSLRRESARVKRRERRAVCMRRDAREVDKIRGACSGRTAHFSFPPWRGSGERCNRGGSISQGIAPSLQVDVVQRPIEPKRGLGAI